MRLLIASALLSLAACGPSTAPTSEQVTAPAKSAAPAAPAGEPMATGLMGGMSTSASDDVAGLTINRDGLTFSSADEEFFSVPTEYLGAVDPSTLIKEGGESFAAVAPSSTATRVELRRLASAAPHALCGGMPATHVAIVYAEPLTGLQLMVFTGADAPGPAARDSEVCAIYAYAVD